MRYNIRKLRSYSLLDALFPKVRIQILATLLPDPSQLWYLSDLARHLGTTPSSLQRELASLVEAGILLKTSDGNRTYYQPDIHCPVFPELQGLLLKTTGLVGAVQEGFEPLQPRIRLAFIYGSFASGQERATSDVDIMVVGSVKLADLALALKPVESKLGRAVNPTLYGEAEFAQRVNDKQHFITTVLRGPKLFIIGTDGDLATVAAGREG